MTCRACADGELPDCTGPGRNGLIWLIHEHRFVEEDAMYPHHIEVQVIDHGRTLWEGGWRVPSIDDAAYVFAEGVERVAA